jgi:predicted TPR repeat methyltransferase
MTDFGTFDTRGYRTVDVRGGYGEWVTTYEQTVEDAMDIHLLEGLREVPWERVARAADLGCGTGRTGAWLRERGIASIALCGITTNHCVETTARMGANLGYDVLFALDATRAFDRTGPDGSLMTADELARATATSLHEEFATVVHTEELVRRSKE